MNYLRNKFLSPKQPQKQQQKHPKPSQNQITHQTNQTKRQVFQSIKQWDKERIDILKKHLNTIQSILEALEFRVRSSQQYVQSIESILKARLKQLQTYKSNSLNNSEFVLMNNYQPGYQESFDLLKELVIFQSQKDDLMTKKYQQLKKLFKDFSQFKSMQTNDEKLSQSFSKNTSQFNNSELSPKKASKENSKRSNYQIDEEDDHQKIDQTSVAMLKSNVRYLIDCELPDINEETSKLCIEVNKLYHSAHNSFTSPSADLYILIQQFLFATRKQLTKHREIGKELVSLNSDFIQREKKRISKVNFTLSEWVKIDQNANEILVQQLRKQCSSLELVQDYYNLEDIIKGKGIEIGRVSIQEYLKQVNIKPFERVQELLLYSFQAFYNKNIEAQVLITIDKFCHLRKPNQLEPQFTFLMTKDICITQQEEFVFRIQKMQRKFLTKQKQFEFSLEFNVTEDVEKWIQAIQCLNGVQLKLKD